MGLRSKDSIEQEMLYKTGADREYYKAALNIVQAFSETQILEEKNKTIEEIAKLEFKKTEAGNTVNDKKIDAKIKQLRSKYKMFNYLIV